MKTIRDLLAEHAFFADLPAEDLDLLAGCGTNVHFSAGSMIMREGDPAEAFYVVRTGQVALELAVPGRGGLVIETLGPGEILGVSWLFPPYRCAFDARAVSETSAIHVNAGCLRTKCDADTRFGYALMSRFAGELRDRLQSTRLRLIDVYGHAAGPA